MEAIKIDVTYRLFQAKDTDGILCLWEQNSGWGGITKQQFNEWFVDTPYGNCLLIVATDEDDEVKGQLVFSPSRLHVNGKIIKALRASAPILDSSLRQSSLHTLEHPSFRLIQKGFEEAARLGFQAIYSYPAFGWKRMLQLMHQRLPYQGELAYYDCFSVSLQNELPITDESYSLRQIDNFLEEHGQLWKDAVHEFPVICAVERDTRWMNWAAGSLLKLEVRSNANAQLIGFCCLKKDGLISDLVARNEQDFKVVLTQCIWAFHQLNAKRISVPFSHIKGMMTKEMRPALETIPYATEDFRFVFDSYLLDPLLDFETFKSPNWYMTPLG